MKKIYLLLLLTVTALNSSLLAQNALIKAPAFPTTTTSLLAPNGTSLHTVQHGCFLLTASELTVVGTNTAINSVGFYLNQGTNGPAVTGTIQIYLQNCADITYLKGNNYTTAIAPMSSVYNNTLTIPAIFGTTAINVTLPSNFTYTGGGLYVAYDWVSTGPFATGAAIFQADNSLGTAGASSSGTVAPAPNIMSFSGTRPVFQIGYVNTYTNEAQVYGVLGNGRQPLIGGSPYTFSVVLRNNAGVAMTNVVPTLSVSGANSFVTTTTVASIPAGGTIIASFPAYTPTTQGMSTVAVTVPSDQNNLNNTYFTTQSITCNYLSSSPPIPIANYNQGVGFPPNSGGLLLNIMSVSSTSTLNALRLGIANYNANTGNGVYGVITNSSGVILATTNTIVITGAMFTTYQTFSFAAPVTLNAGATYYVGLAQPTAVVAYFPLASMPTATNNVPPNIYATSILGGGLIFAATPTLGVFAIESVLNNGITLTVTPLSSTICSGNSVSITASGATTYSWSNGANTSSISVTPNVYTAYTCTGSTIIGTVGTCEDIKTSQVFVNVTPTINCPNGAICPVGGSYTMVPSGAATYTYAGGGPVVTPTITSNYTITATSGAGCPSLPKVVTVSVQPNITVAISGPTIMCDGNNVVLTGTGAATYSWSSGPIGNSVIVSPTTTTTYTLFGTFGSCSNTAVQTVSVSPQLTVTAYASPSTICVGNTGTLIAYGSVGAGTTTFSWSTGATTQSIAVSPTVNTTYTVSGVSNGVCSSFTTVTQLVDPCIGFKELHNSAAEIKIYPNPNNGSFAIMVSSITNNSVIELYNGLGQMVLQQKVNDTTTNLNLTSLAKGVYILQLKENNYSVKTTRMIVQ